MARLQASNSHADVQKIPENRGQWAAITAEASDRVSQRRPNGTVFGTFIDNQH